jgi:hypothetical protein
MTLLQEVRAKVIEAVPEIVELKQGCKIVQKYSLYPWTVVVSPVFEEGGESFVYTTDPNGQRYEKVFLERYSPNANFIRDILGRPVTLADVLLAITFHRNHGPANLGGFTRDLLNLGWKLSLPLDEQDEDAIGFLHKMLV